MLTLGHIIYSNTFPPHAGIVTGAIPFPFKITEGIPSELNRLLAQGAIDVSSSSSIEYALNQQRYRVFPGFSITSRKEVRSIILQSRVPIGELDRKKVGLTTASATSVVLLKVLLKLRYRLQPIYFPFVQGTDDPFRELDAALFIGDLALKIRSTVQHPYLYDLGALWHEFTGLPFVFALWQINYKKDVDNDLARLYDILNESKSYGLSHIRHLAERNAERFDLPVQLLVDYWTSFSYDLGRDEQKGLMAFYGFATEIGAIGPVAGLHFWNRE